MESVFNTRRLFTITAILFVALICRAEKFVGEQCTLHDGVKGVCKNENDCESLKKGIMLRTLTFASIVTCSFQGNVPIVCCADETPRPTKATTRRPVIDTKNDITFEESNENESTTSTRRPPHGTRDPPVTNPLPKPRNSLGSRAEAACATYSKLPIHVSGISWNILGGVDTSLGEFPWMAALQYETDNVTSFDCGGTLISDEFILTAAHCAPTKRPPRKVRLGKVTLLTNDDDAIALDISIREIFRHPRYSASMKKNDIALIRLAERINFTEDIRPACLRTELDDILPHVQLTITGWGSTSAERTLRPEVLLKTNVTSLPLPACNTTLLEFNRQPNLAALRNGLSESQCCAYDPAAKNDACQGDSGGPLQIFPNTTSMATIVGVISFGVSCGTELPSIYTRVAYFLDWIEPLVWPENS